MPNRGSIIAFDVNKWAGPWMNRQQFFSRLAQRGWNIVYSTGQPTLWDRHQSNFKSLPFWANHDIANGVILDVPGKALASWPNFIPWHHLCRYMHAQQLTRLARQYSPQQNGTPTPLIAYIFHPSFYPYVHALNPDYLVFHVRDAYPEEPRWTKNNQIALEQLADQADLIVSSGNAMTSCLPHKHQHRAVIIPNGADADAFIQGTYTTCPDDLARIPCPRVCYAGRLNAKIDLPLLYELALQRPHYNFVIIGLIVYAALTHDREAWKLAIDKLQKLPNVHYLGYKKPEELPSYVAHTNVNLMIYAVNDENARWAKYCYPLKLHEYLAAGQPIVSAPLEAIESFPQVIACAQNKEEWLQAIDDAIHHGGIGTKEERQATARANSWNERTNLLEESIQNLIKQGHE